MDTKQLFIILEGTIADMSAEGLACPEGVLYAGCMSKVSLEEFQSAISRLESTGLIERRPSRHELMGTVKLTQKMAAARAAGARV